MKKIKRESFGAGEFTIVCEPKEVSLIIHKTHVVAKSNADVYEKIFDYAVKVLGGRIDGLK